MNLRSLVEHAEMGILVMVFRAASWTTSIKRLVRFAAALAERLPSTFGEVDRRAAIGAAERAAERASRLVPGARCLHRALASRVWLARRGVRSGLVVGFRRDGALEGHAWLELEGPRDGEELFVEQGYQQSFREADLVEEGPVPGEYAPREEEAERIATEEE